MRTREERKIREKAELNLIKNRPQRPININSHREITQKEKVILIITSKPFVITASILTVGLYYAYYVFCLDQVSRTPFTEFPGKHYEYTGPRRDLEAEKKIKEINAFARRLQRLFSNTDREGILNQAYRKAYVTINRIGINIVIFFGHLVTFFGTTFSKATGTNIGVDKVNEWKERLRKIHQEREQKLKNKIIEKLNLNADKDKRKEDQEFDFGYVIRKSLELNTSHKPKDYYYVFLFWVSYVVASIVTLGALPIRHYLNRGKDDLMKIGEQKSFFDAYEFDDLVGRLIGLEQKVEFSSVLIAGDGDFVVDRTCMDLFRTKFFRYGNLRRKTVMALVAGTLGIFGLVVSIESFRNKEPNLEGILEIDTKPTYREDMEKYEKIRRFCDDFFWDIKMAIRLASIKEFKIRNVASFAVRSEDRLVSSFINFISSPIYVVAFSAFFVISSVIAFGMFLFSSWTLSFFIFFILVCLFLGSFSKHVSLLFS